MAQDQSPKKLKAYKVLRPPLISLKSASKALKNIRPSSQALQSFLSAPTLMNPEIQPVLQNVSPPLTREASAPQRRISPLHLGALQRRFLFRKSKSSDQSEEYDVPTGNGSQSTVSQQHLTYPAGFVTEEQPEPSLELPRINSPESVQNVAAIERTARSSATGNDKTRTGFGIRFLTFSDYPVYVQGSKSIQQHDVAHMIELHMLAWQEDLFVRRLQRDQVPRAEIKVMRKMLDERTSSPLDSILVARIDNSQHPLNIIGWLCCSIIRSKPASGHLADENEIRALDWNLATAVNLNRNYNAGLTMQLFGGPSSLEYRNYLIEVVSRGTCWSQKMALAEKDFIAITNLVVHPSYPKGREIGMRLVQEACTQASQLRMPIYVFTAGDYCTALYKESCGFVELGEHRSMLFEPEYRWKYFLLMPSREQVELVENSKEAKGFDFGWKAFRGL